MIRVGSDPFGRRLHHAEGLTSASRNVAQLDARMTFLQLLSQTVPEVLESLHDQFLQPYTHWLNQQVAVPCGFTLREKRPWRRLLRFDAPDCTSEMRSLQLQLRSWQERFHLRADWTLESAAATLNFWAGNPPLAYLRDYSAQLRSWLDLESSDDVRRRALQIIERVEDARLFWAHPLPDEREALFCEEELRLHVELEVPSPQSTSRARATALLRKAANAAIKQRLDELALCAKERGWQTRRKPPRRNGELSSTHLLWFARWQVQESGTELGA
jgi:hypothetical protein